MFGKLQITLILVLIITLGVAITLPVLAAQPETAPPTISCAQPDPKDVATCAVLEANMLASVVRLVFHSADPATSFSGSTSHATVLAGRYLLTHNHFNSFDLPALSPANPQGVSGFTLYNAGGATLVRRAPVGTFQVAFQADEILVLDFGDGFFTELGLTSASLLTTDEVRLTVGAEVAQVDWDAERAYVIWTTILASNADEDAPYIEVDNYVIPGASGGGVFWNGFHIGNNWSDIIFIDSETGNITQTYSRVALNLETVLP